MLFTSHYFFKYFLRKLLVADQMSIESTTLQLRVRCFGCHNCLHHVVITARSELRKVLFLAPSVCGFLFVHEISRKPMNGFAPNSHGRRIWSLARKSLKVKVKDQKSRSPGTVNGTFRSFRRFMFGKISLASSLCYFSLHEVRQ